MQTSFFPATRGALAAVLSGLGALALLLVSYLSPLELAHAAPRTSKPTIVLVHGAFAESSGWNPVAQKLITKGYPVVALGNPLRGLGSDAAYVARSIDAIDGPIVLVGHSYGGSVISAAAVGKSKVKALVYVAGFALDTGETTAALASKFPGSTLGGSLAPAVPLEGGGKDLYIDQSKFRAQFAADLPPAETQLMAATQRPIAEAALNEPTPAPAWKTLPSWFIFGSLDNNIPRASLEFMAKRAGGKKVIEIGGASHVVMLSHPEPVVKLIEEAAAASTS